MKTFAALSLAILVWLLPVSQSSAAVVTWGFSGVLSRADNNSNAVPNTVVEGTPFTGVVIYDTAFLQAPDENPSPSAGAYYFSTTAGFSISVQVGGATFSSTIAAPGDPSGGVTIGDNVGNSADQLDYFASANPPLVTGAPVQPVVTSGGISISFADSTKTAFTSDALPLSAPNASAYGLKRISISAYSPGAENSVFYIEGNITSVSELPKVLLGHRPLAGNQLRLSWPKSATGLTLQFATSLTTQNWTTEPTAVVDTATEHTVTVSTTGQPKFFRLVKLP